MTAEGDNSVLMQKVSKELLAAFQSKKISYPKVDISNVSQWNIQSLDVLFKLVQLRELGLLRLLDLNPF